MGVSEGGYGVTGVKEGVVSVRTADGEATLEGKLEIAD